MNGTIADTARLTGLQRVAIGIGKPLSFLSRRSPDIITRVLLHLHRPLIGSCDVRITHGTFHIVVNPQDYCGGRLYYWGHYEPEQTEVFKSLLRRVAPATFLDVGANIGYYSLLAASQGIPKVISVEASPPIVQMLEASVAANPKLRERITVIPSAVSDKQGELTFYVNRAEHNYGLGSIVRGQKETGAQPVKVPCIQADTLVSTQELPPGPLFCKIDIEGAELLALNGMVKVIEQKRPVFILEIHPEELAEMGQSAGAVLDFLWRYDYRIVRLEQGGEAPVDKSTILPEGNFWLIAYPNT